MEYNIKEIQELTYRLYRASANLNLYAQYSCRFNPNRMMEEMSKIKELYDKLHISICNADSI